MSETDSFIDEVTEEVRRDRMFLLFKRWGWVGALAVVVIVGGAAFNEYRKSQDTAAAQALGDQIIAALAENEAADRAAKLSGVSAETAGGGAIVQMMISAAQGNSDQRDAAVAGLEAVAADGDLPLIYRQIASFKALTLQSDSLPAPELRLQFEALAQPGAPLRLLAQEQLALIDVAEGMPDEAIARLQAIIQDAEAPADLQQRAAQLIVALGGEPAEQPRQQG
ncbi:MAG: hypothetical protein AAF408_07220 [Pseudomonadota bacterium]